MFQTFQKAASRSTRHMLAMIGPIGTAGSQFLLSILLMHAMEPDAFGRFSFLLILTQLSWGVWSALFCAPLSALILGADAEAALRAERRLFSASLLGSGIAFFFFFAVCLMLAIDTTTSIVFALYAALALLRWFSRALAYAHGRQWSVTRSDISYAIVILAAPFVIRLFPQALLLGASLALLFSMLISMILLQPRGLRAGLAQFTFSHARDYIEIWRTHGRWALLGVLTTEATANGHVYLVTLLRGPEQFAPIAASALLIRPLVIGSNALSEYERPRMARIIASNDLSRARKGVWLFRALLGVVWLGTATAAAGLMLLAPRLVFPARYDQHMLATAGILWMVVGLVRLIRQPDSVLMQAAGAFRTLAMASLWSALVSLVAVTLWILAAGPLWSILGIIFGEMIFAMSVWKRSRQWMSERERQLCPE